MKDIIGKMLRRHGRKKAPATLHNVHPHTVLCWSWMNVLTVKRASLLREKFGDLDTALDAITPEILMELGCREETALQALNRLEELDRSTYASELTKRNITIIAEDDDRYPQALRHVEDRPMFLSARGDLSILRQPCLAMVGAREISEYGRRVARTIVPDIVRAGMVTISGLAQGIDAEVAKETLAAHGRTVAVLGHGMGMIYPKAHASLAESIVSGGGLLLSEFPLDTAPDKYTFPARNRIIAGLSLGTVVLQAAEGSGSLITAELALDYNREVFAVPGQIFDTQYQGCHRLIAQGHATLVTSAQEILERIGVQGPRNDAAHTHYDPASAEEACVLHALTSMPQDADKLAEATGLSAASLGAILTMLELHGAAENVGSGRWVRR